MNTPFNAPLNRRRLLCGCAGLATLSLLGCGQSGAAASSAPAEIDAQASCSLDGMLLADYPGPKGQIRYDGVAEVQWFCDSVELLSVLLAPEQVRAVQSAHVQDMALADWDQPRGHWIDARQALYVLGSKRHGSMGPTAASFATESAAQTFMQQHGGRLLRYAEIQPGMVDLSGGALHDTRM
ncbi:MAG: nitrous oxide reductase accessory protein NosL [Burkholderiales bacterium RIFCSPLOWO2_12_67_14]|nr:MAG: nitrous oxide reductase accessory protein NosL [Burkholderiales bacterium RIFCSPLOWO2_02_FULL_67_64]OGB40442.1 MAG: nitrous oxide reductase accessory protein NosL [Burkholderiales bacterium RIFCSPHIGHO2_12_FULL_67_38]OGB42783.1 MAG: nitrous oxide reductase accessory protein NosL [Burkholderiales bacterium RIFCSPLOWO2_12_67_14]OGB84420.1 MAG: nitrous oxide reductase accessory protein NosL [Burkholderiales bacterium RIFCSPLOWO2_12_FULL_67_210]